MLINSDDYLLSAIAKLYYIDKVKQNEIAKRFNITSMTVSRYLKEAESKEIVTFHVKSPWNIDMEKGNQIMKKYNLRDCIVVKIKENESISTTLGNFLANYVSARITDETTIGFSWGHTISKFVEAFPMLEVKNCNLLQLTGMFVSSDYSVTPQNIISQISNKVSGRIYMTNAPLYVKTKDVRDQLIHDATNEQLWEFAKKSDINIIGVSGMDETASTIKRGTISAEDANELRSIGSIGDVAGTYIDNNGKIVDWSKSDCYTGVPLELISEAKNVICVAGEIQKANVIRKAAEQKYFNTLVTSDIVAQELLKE